MDKRAWQAYYGLIDEEMERISQTLAIFGGKIIVKDADPHRKPDWILLFNQ